MYFKQLELCGFKSFADRTSLRLEPGITAVVGPNGCGKSNILDALRWALGEQSARELRGSHMQDVVFNGSEQRNAMGMAEVSLTFDNADSRLPVDFAEVQVTRRVYRSGESEYLINKAPCRLKDIQELFMDTGIGTQAYSMVGQGKMDLILSSKPEDRRFLFEEAAGIIKYKKRKALAMRRLDSAEQNLLRLGDIIAEVERQMRSLKRQVNAAIRYREISGQLRELEIRSAWLQFTRLSQDIIRLRGEFGASQDAYEKVSATVTKLEARREKLGLAQLENERVLLVRREGVHGIDSEMEQIERGIALLRQQTEFAKEQQQQALRERDTYTERAAALTERMAETAVKAEELRREAAQCETALNLKTEAHAQSARGVAEAEAKLEAMRARAAERVDYRTKTLTELETLGVSIENIDTQVRNVCARFESISTQREELSQRLDAVRSEQSEKGTVFEGIERTRAEKQALQAGKSEELRAAETKWQALREQKSSIEARLASLRELRDTYEGFATGVRAIMRAKAESVDAGSRVIGPIGDLLSTGKEYERAIEAALGGNINNVVVEDADAAKEAIDFLKRNTAGRVTFLPLDIIRGGLHGDEHALDGDSGVVGAAIDFVRHEPRLRNAVEYLLHSTVIVRTLDDAIRIARGQRSYPRLVTLEGEVVSQAGAVTGGRMKHESRGLLGRSAEIAELEQTVSATEAELNRMTAVRNGLTDALRELAEEIKNLAAQAEGVRRELNELGVTAARNAAELDNLTSAAQDLEKQRLALAHQRQDLDVKHQAVAVRASTMQSDDEALQSEIAEAQLTAAQMREALSACAGELTDLRIRQNTLLQRIEETDREHVREAHDRDEAHAEASRRERTAKQLNEEQKSIEERIAVDVERLKALSETKEEARVKVVEAENERSSILDETEKIEGQLRGLREEARRTQSAVHHLELQLRDNEAKVGFFQERILSEYAVALASLDEAGVGTDEYEDGRRDELVGELRTRLQRMGEVNLMAIEEYEELEKRFSFLTTQSDDLHQARQDLLGVIERSDRRIREMFLDTFRKVEDYFHTYFRRLFNGGQARIYLIDEDDPLESGIEIEARPPGKKPQSISLLSGGESAMTAIALLFSIFKAKPSPFCILDEVDAPLDDANIGRFLTLLDEFTAESQFVIITHNKSTMAKADALYGVTMQERGVSQLVSVRFDEVKDAGSAA